MSSNFDRLRKTISKLIEGTLTTYEWDDNMSIWLDEPKAEALRQIANMVGQGGLFPPTDRREYTSDEGLEFFKLLLEATVPSETSEERNTK